MIFFFFFQTRFYCAARVVYGRRTSGVAAPVVNGSHYTLRFARTYIYYTFIILYYYYYYSTDKNRNFRIVRTTGSCRTDGSDVMLCRGGRTIALRVRTVSECNTIILNLRTSEKPRTADAFYSRACRRDPDSGPVGGGGMLEHVLRRPAAVFVIRERGAETEIYEAKSVRGGVAREREKEKTTENRFYLCGIIVVYCASRNPQQRQDERTKGRPTHVCRPCRHRPERAEGTTTTTKKLRRTPSYGRTVSATITTRSVP